jgi:quercetin dioxygenase-like cupin family protein
MKPALRSYLHRLAALSLVSAAIFSIVEVQAQQHHTAMSGDAIKWGAAPPSLPPGAQAAVVLGSPAKEGLFVLYLKFPAGFVVPPHRHSKDELVTVISGNFVITAAEKVDRPSIKALPAGSFFHLPAGTAHYAVAETESVVQLSGMGPFDVTYIDPKDDPRKK